MRCPTPGCESDESAVKETRRHPDTGSITRKRLCKRCRHLFTTTEQVSRSGMSVIKADGRLVAFDPDSLFMSIHEATGSWHSGDEIRAMIAAIANDLYSGAEPRPVASSRIGQLVLERLRQLNPVAHIRFALAFAGRVDRSDQSGGMTDARDVRQWLIATYPHLEEQRPATGLSDVAKMRRGLRERFDHGKLKRAVEIICTGRHPQLASQVTNDIEVALEDQPIVTSAQISCELLRSLRARDDIAYLRYASIVKGFATPLDYEAEALALTATRRKDAHRASGASPAGT